MMSAPTYVAFHEAGHAVMALLEHFPVDQVTIKPDVRTAGHALTDTFYMTEDEANESGIAGWEQLRAEANARVALAGEVAQTIHAPGSADVDELASDHDQYADMILRLAKTDDEQRAYGALLLLQTQTRLRAHWDAVERVAALLQQKMTIDANELRNAMWPGLQAALERARSVRPAST